ncbi:methionyl-tRNA formyltransferase [Thiotrichales bacterium HSG1]|nr:methionyl-tRNA formyltransferase [Thiotrichales bacterium HSG1]
MSRIIFAGTPQFSVPSLLALLNSKHTVCAVYTQPDRKAGRGRKLQASQVKQTALQHNIDVYQPTTLKDTTVQNQLEELQADLMVVVAYGLILPKIVLEAPQLGCINIHASLLPRWRGAAPIQRALLAGDDTTGVTLMQMDVGLDSGGMIKTANCEILSDDNSQTLHDRLSVIGAKLLTDTIDEIGNLPVTPQDDSCVTYASKLEKAEAKLDWNEPAIVLERKIRAFNPWPVAQVELFGQTLRIWKAQIISSSTTEPIGKVIYCQPDGIDVVTSDGILRILIIQKSGKKPISVSDFLNANPKYLCGK